MSTQAVSTWCLRGGASTHHLRCGGRRIQDHHRVACECGCHSGVVEPVQVRAYVPTAKGHAAVAHLPPVPIPPLAGLPPARTWFLTDKAHAYLARLGQRERRAS